MNIVVDGKRYTNFISAEVDSRLDAISRHFSFVASTVTGIDQLPFRPGQECEILVDDEKIMTGFVERIEFVTNDRGNTYTISGRDKLADLVDSNLPGLSDTGVTVKQACERVLSFLQIDCKVIDLADTSSRPFKDEFDLVAPEPTDTAADFLLSVARRRQALLTSDGDGNLVITEGIGNRIEQRLVNRHSDPSENNMTEVRFVADHSQRFGLYVTENQLNVAAIGSEGGSASARDIAGVEASFSDPDGIRSSRVRGVTSESSYPPGDANSRAVYECNISRARSRQYVATVPSHRDQNQILWAPNTAPIVEDEFAGISGRMLVTGIKYLLDQDKGKTSILTLTDPGAYRVLAEESDGFDL